jgi:hypothetical protein
VLVTQWSALGVPLHPAFSSERLEVIDPECLLWASLPYLGREPRLTEGVGAWMAANPTVLIWTRLNQVAKRDTSGPHLRTLAHSAESPGTLPAPTKSLASRMTGTSTLLLRSREILGNDIRSFLIVHLLASPKGIRLRSVASLTWYAYRSVSQTVATWERAGLVSVDHGHCVLLNPSPWRELLDCVSSAIAIVDWKLAYEAARELLRTREQGKSLGFPSDHPLLVSAAEKARTSLRTAAVGSDETATPAIQHLIAGL